MQAISVNTNKSAQASTSSRQHSTPLEPQVADRLLDLLSTDNSFRRLFKNDPAAALAQLGFELPRTARIGCYGVTSIAPKKEIAAAREWLKAYLTSNAAPTNPHCFEAGEVSVALRRVNR